MAQTHPSSAKLVDTGTKLREFLASITESSELYLDLEGFRLSRNGTIAIITALVRPGTVISLIDITKLGDHAFTEKFGDKTLKSILESPTIAKYFWDVRNDADALWAHYKVGVHGVIDIQLLENATRNSDKVHLLGLDQAIQGDLKPGFKEINRWLRIKNEMKDRMTTDVFAVRPLEEKTMQYCCNDVVHLPELHANYMRLINDDWLRKVKVESGKRADTARSPGYDPQAESKKLGPWPSISFDEMLEQWEDAMMEQRAQDIFGNDDSFDYYGEYDDDYDPWEDQGGNNAADGAFDEEAFHSDWDRGS